MTDDKEGNQEVTPTLFMHRMNLCGSCEHMKKGFKISRCNLCGCILAAKARNKNEHCPIHKW